MGRNAVQGDCTSAVRSIWTGARQVERALQRKPRVPDLSARPRAGSEIPLTAPIAQLELSFPSSSDAALRDVLPGRVKPTPSRT